MGILRVLLAVAVLADHSKLFGSLVMMPGQEAVNTFFMISGFYMALVLSTKYAAQGAWRTFYSNRYMRLYPTYLLICIATWAWFFTRWSWAGTMPPSHWAQAYAQMDWLPKLGLILSNWTMLGNEIPYNFFFSAETGFTPAWQLDAAPPPQAVWGGLFCTIPPAWSIGVELWFYLVAPWLVRWRSGTLCAVAALSLAGKILLKQQGVATYYFFPTYLFFFIGGILACRLMPLYAASVPDIRRLGFVAAIVISVLVTFYSVIKVPGQQHLFYVLVALAMPAMFLATKNSAGDRWIGNLSYPVYLSHMLVLEVAAFFFKGQTAALLGVLVTLAVSVLLVHWIENPLDRWRQQRAARVSPGTRGAQV